MADRFPSIEDLDAGQAPAEGNPSFDDDADPGDFLSRERAALGDDAAQFTTAQDGVPQVSVEDDDDDDLLGGGGMTNGNSADVSQFQTSFPSIDSRNEAVAPGGSITGSGSPFLPGGPTTAPRTYSPAPYPPEEEPEVIKAWREQRNASIAQREEAAARRKEETVKAAQEAIDEFYENYNKKRERGIAQTKKDAEEFLKNREDTAVGGTSWERISKLVDVQKGGKGAAAGGKEKFRDLLQGLTKDENAPGAKGY